MKAVTYYRCSGLGQVSGDTWDRQQDAARACAAELGIEITGEYREEGVKGKTDAEDRPAFQQMVADLLANGCRTVIVENLSRLAREYRVQEQILIYLATKEISIIAADTRENVTEAMMGDPMRRALVQIQGIFHELDKGMLVAKLNKARRRIREKGQKCEGKKAFGFHPDRPEEKETLALMVSLSKTMNPLQIANELNRRGIKPRQAAQWHHFSVSRILQRVSVAA